jgi:hypothetical protein
MDEQNQSLIRRLFSRPPPMAPDRPQGFVPQSLIPKLSGVRFVFAKLPNGEVIQVFPPDEPATAADGAEPGLLVPCADQEDMDILSALARRHC